jgi:hypothetical protein
MPVFARQIGTGWLLPRSTTAAMRANYERRGFRVVTETDVPESEVHLWLMRRDRLVALCWRFTRHA